MAESRCKKIVYKLFSAEGMLGKQERKGELMPSKEYYKGLFRLAWPSALESVLVSLIGAIDLIMVGTIGPAAISAVGITNQPKFVLLAMIFSLNAGVTAIVARRYGQEDIVGANRCLRQSIIISGLISFIMAFLGYTFAEPLMKFAGADPEFLGLATSYFKIVMLGFVFNGISLTINSAQRGAGNTKVSLTTNLCANIVNMIFNFLLINGVWFFPKLGVDGAALATTIGNFAGFLLSVRSISYKGRFLSIRDKYKWAFDKKTVLTLCNIGGAAAMEQVFMRVGFFAYAKIVASLGTVAFATHQICMQIINFSFAFGDGLNIATSALVGQSLGRERPDEAIINGRTGQRLAFAVSTPLFCIFLFGGKFLVWCFSREPEILLLGSAIMVIVAFTTHIQTSQVVFTGCLRGAGDTKFVAMTSFISIAVIRPLLTYLLCIPFGFGLYGAWFALLIDQAMRLTLNMARFRTGKWTKIKI